MITHAYSTVRYTAISAWVIFHPNVEFLLFDKIYFNDAFIFRAISHKLSIRCRVPKGIKFLNSNL